MSFYDSASIPIETQIKKMHHDDRPMARVAMVHKGGLVVEHLHGRSRGILTGRLMMAEGPDRPAVGDWVYITPMSADEVVVTEMIPRLSCISRKSAGSDLEQVMAANVDLVFIVSALDADLNPGRIERYLAMCRQAGIPPVLVFTKADACQNPEQLQQQVSASVGDITSLRVSSYSGEGMDRLAALLKPEVTAVFVGSSGVGKSTLVNALSGEERMATGEIRQSDGKGRHTTTHRELLHLPGGAVVIDTPGIRELGVWGDEQAVDGTFPEIEMLAKACRFGDCSHTNEPRCAVQEAVNEGQLSAERLTRYHKMQREVERLQQLHNPSERWKEKQRHRDFGRMIKEAKAIKRRR